MGACWCALGRKLLLQVAARAKGNILCTLPCAFCSRQFIACCRLMMEAGSGGHVILLDEFLADSAAGSSSNPCSFAATHAPTPTTHLNHLLLPTGSPR